MAGAVDVGVVAVGRFVLNVGGVDGDAAGLFFGCRVNLVVPFGFAAELGRQHCRDRRRQGGLAMVDVANRADVDVRLGPLKFAFCHFQPRKVTKPVTTTAGHNLCHANFKYGAHCGNRTRDLSLTKGVLCH